MICYLNTVGSNELHKKTRFRQICWERLWQIPSKFSKKTLLRTGKFLSPHLAWLVVFRPTPLKNMSSSVGTIIPKIYAKIKVMFQSTNQFNVE